MHIARRSLASILLTVLILSLIVSDGRSSFALLPGFAPETIAIEKPLFGPTASDFTFGPVFISAAVIPGSDQQSGLRDRAALRQIQRLTLLRSSAPEIITQTIPAFAEAMAGKTASAQKNLALAFGIAQNNQVLTFVDGSIVWRDIPAAGIFGGGSASTGDFASEPGFGRKPSSDSLTRRFGGGGNSSTTTSTSSSGFSQSAADDLYVNVSGDTMNGALVITSNGLGLTVLGTASGDMLHAERLLTVSGSSVFDGNARFNSTVTLNGVTYSFPASDGTSSGKVLKTNAAGQLSWSTDIAIGTGLSQSSGDARYVNASGDTMTGTLVINLTSGNLGLKIINTASGNILHAEKDLTSSGTLAVSGIARLKSNLNVVGTISGSVLQIMAGSTNYIQGTLGIGTTSPKAKLDVAGTISGNTLVISKNGSFSGTLTAVGNITTRGNLSGSTIAGFALGSCNGSTQKLLFNNSTGQFSCGTDLGGSFGTGNVLTLGDARYVNTSGDTMTGALTINLASGNLGLKIINTASGNILHAEKDLTSSGTLTVTGITRLKSNLNVVGTISGGALQIMAGSTNYIQGTLGIGTSSPKATLDVRGTLSGSRIFAASAFSGAGLVTCSAVGQKLLWNAATQQFSCSTDLNTVFGTGNVLTLGDARYVNTSGDTMTGALTINLTSGNLGLKIINTASGNILHAEKDLTSSGTLTVTGITRLKSNLNVVGTISGAVLQIMAGSTNYIQGTLGIGTTSPKATLDVRGTLSGSRIFAANAFSGAGLVTCSAAGQKLLWNSTTQQFSCSTDLNTIFGTGNVLTLGDARYVNTSGDTMTGVLTVNITNGDINTVGIKVINTLSGAILHAERVLTSSGGLIFEGAASGSSLYLGTSLRGAGLSSCTGGNKLLWDSTSGRFTCGVDQSSGTGLDQNSGDARYVNQSGDTMTGALTINLTSGNLGLKILNTASGNILHAEKDLTSSGTLTVTGIARLKSNLNVVGTISGGALQIMAGSTNTIQGTLGIGTTAPKAKLDVSGTISGNTLVISRNGSFSGALIVAGNITTKATLSGVTIAGFSLGTCNGSTQKLLYNFSTQKFECGSDQTGGTNYFGTGNVLTVGDARYVNVSGDTMTGALVINVNGGTINTIGLRIINTLSGAILHAEREMTSSGSITAFGNILARGNLSGRNLVISNGASISGALLVRNGITSKSFLSGATFYGAGLASCTGSNQKLLYSAATGTFSCATNLTANFGTGNVIATGDARYVNTSGDTMTGALVINLTSGHLGLKIINTASGNILHAEKDLTSSGTLTVSGIARLKNNLNVVGTISGNALQIMNGTSYLLGSVGIGTTAPKTKLDVQGTISGNTLTISKNGSFSGALITVGNITTRSTFSGSNLTVSNSASISGSLLVRNSITSKGSLSGATIAGFALSSCNGSTQKLLYNNSTQRFECGTDLAGTANSFGSGNALTIGDARYVKKQGDTMTGALTVNITGGNINTIGLKVINTLSGAHIHAEKTLTSSGTITAAGNIIAKGYLSGSNITISRSASISGTLLVKTSITSKGYLSGATFYGAGLGTCTGSTQKLLYDVSTGRFSCGTDQTAGNSSVGTGNVIAIGDARYVNQSGDTMTGALTINLSSGNLGLKIVNTASGNILHAEKDLTSSGTLTVVGITRLKNNLNVVGTISGGALQIMNGTSYLLGSVGIGTSSPKAKLDVVGTISGTTLTISKNGSFSGALTVVSNITTRGNLSGSNLTVSNSASISGSLLVRNSITSKGSLSGATIAGFALGTCNAFNEKLLYNNSTQKFECGTDQTGAAGAFGTGNMLTVGDARYVKKQGDTMTGTLIINLSSGHLGLRILQTASGNIIHAEKSLTSSGLLMVTQRSIQGSGALVVMQFANSTGAYIQGSGAHVGAPLLALDSSTGSARAPHILFGYRGKFDVALWRTSGAVLNLSGHLLPGLTNKFDLGSSAMRWKSLYLSGGTLYLGNNSNQASINYNTSSSRFGIDSNTDGTNELSILSTGNVGIGTLAPKAKLDVQGTISGSNLVISRGASISGTLLVKTSITSKGTISGVTIAGFALGSCSSASTSKLLYNNSTQQFECGTDQSAGGLSFGIASGIFVKKSGSTMTGALVINLTSGNLGLKIVNTASGNIIHAEKSLSSSGTIIATGTIATKGTLSGAALTVMNGNSYLLGSVGIGMSGTPKAKLDVQGTISGAVLVISRNASISGSLIVKNNLSGSALFSFGLGSCSNGTSSKLLYNNSTGKFSCGTDQTTAGSSVSSGGVITIGDTRYVKKQGDTMTGTLKSRGFLLASGTTLVEMSGWNESLNLIHSGLMTNSVTRLTKDGDLKNIGTIQSGEANFRRGGTFLPKSNYTTGTAPISVAIGDLNGDGNQDVVSANSGGSNSLSVLLSNGTGSFATKVDYTTGVGANFVAIGELNGDGKPDLAVANSTSGTVSVFINKGNGTFASKVDYATGADPYAVAIGDLNNDGKADLVATDTSIDKVSVLLNNGNGTFATKVDYSTGTYPIGVDIADLNGDGKADLVTTNGNSDSLSVFFNNGNGTFATKVDYPAAGTPWSVAIGNLNSDEKPDLAVTNQVDGSVSVFINNGNGTFATKVDYTAGANPLSVSVGDLNGDGKADLAVANSFSTSNSISVFLNRGNGIFASKVDYSVVLQPYSVAIGDLNGDGKSDLVAGNTGGSSVSVLLNDARSILYASAGTGGAVGIGTATPGSALAVSGAVIINRGGNLANAKADLGITLEVIGTASGRIFHAQDMLRSSGSLIVEGNMSGATLQGAGLASCNGGGQKLLYNNSTKKFECGADLGGGAFGTGNVLAVGDTRYLKQSGGTLTGALIVNLSSGYLGLRILQTASGNIIHAEKSLTSSGTILATGGITSKSSLSGASLFVGGMTDCSNSTTSKVVYNLSTGKFSCATDQTSGFDYSAATGIFVNQSGDTMTGALTISLTSGHLGLRILQTASGNILHAEKTLTSSGNIIAGTDIVAKGTIKADAVVFTSGTTLAEMSGWNEYLNIIDSGLGTNSVTRLTNQGDLVNIGTIQSGEAHFRRGGTFAPKVDYTTGSDPTFVAIGDLNGDGKADLATVNDLSDSISVFINTGTGSFATKVDYTTGTRPWGIAIGDLNGDGKPDLVAANHNDDSVSIFLNKGNGTFAAKVDYTTSDAPRTVAIGDLNGDGKLDLAVAYDLSTSAVSIFLNNGNGTFAAKVNYTTETNARFVAIGDLNGDGKMDLAVTNSQIADSSVSIFLNNGNGTFAAKVNYTTGTSPYSVAIGDLNGDGKADLATSNYGSGANSASVLLNNGNGTFAAKVDYATGLNPHSVAIGDLNGDGKADLAVANLNVSSQSVSILFNNGNGTFATKVDYGTGTTPVSVAIGDFNSDGKADLVVANDGSDTVSVFLNVSKTILFASAGTGGAVGIGTSTPGSALAVSGAVLINRNGNILNTAADTGLALEVIGTASGRVFHAQDVLRSSGSLIVEGNMSGATLQGAGLYNCNSSTVKLLYNSSTKKFECGTDLGANSVGTGNVLTIGDSRYVRTAGGTMTGALTINLSSGTLGLKILQTASGNIIHAEKSLSSSGTLTIKGKTLVKDTLTISGSGHLLAGLGAQSGTVTRTTLSIGSGGYANSIAIAPDGSPIITSQATTATLQVIKCGNSNCSAGNITTNHTTLTNYNDSSIAIPPDGLPVIAVASALPSDALRIVKCTDSACTGATTATVGSSFATFSVSIALEPDGLPFVAYHDVTNDLLKVTKCGDASCSSGNTTTTIESNTHGAGVTQISIAIPADGLPVVSYYDTANADLKVLKCGNAACSSGNTTTTVDSTGVVGLYSSVAIGADGFPVISYHDSTNSDLKVVKCGNSTCSGSNTTTIVNTSGGTDTSISIGRDGLPIISYIQAGLKITKCGNPSCNGGTITTSVDANGGGYTAITTGSDGLPVIAYQQAITSTLRVARCADPTCSKSTAPAFTRGLSIGAPKGNERSFSPAFEQLNVISIGNPTSFRNLTFAVNGIERMALTSRGILGIGTSGSTILNSSNIPAGSVLIGSGALCVDNGSSACDDAARVAGRIYAKSSSVTAIDVAENYPTLDPTIVPGELVATDPLHPVFVRRATGAQNERILGVISTNPGLLLGGFSQEQFSSYTQVPVALAGRVPVRVTASGGSIAVGDFLSLHSLGIAKKSSGGQTIGYALEAFTGSSLGTIQVFINLGSSSLPSLSDSGAALRIDVAAGTPGLVIDARETDPSQDELRIITDVGSSGNTVFRVNAGGNVYADGHYNSAGADYAEWFIDGGQKGDKGQERQKSLEPGEVVCIDLLNNNSVRRCERSGDPNVMGIVSTNPAFVGNVISGAEGLIPPGYALIGLIGQVPAKPTLENGPINPGDSVTSATQPGFIRKASAGESTVGVALEAYDGSPFDSAQGNRVRTINVLISRRNQSLTVETIEQKVLDQIASMNLTDEISQLVNQSSINLNIEDKVTLALAKQLEAFDLASEVNRIIDERLALLNDQETILTSSGQPLTFGETLTGTGTQAPASATASLTENQESGIRNQELRLAALEEQFYILHSTFSISSGSALHAAALTLSSGATINGTLRLSGALILSTSSSTLGPITLNGSGVTIGSLFATGSLKVLGNITITGLADFLGDVRIQGDLILSSRQAGFAMIPASGTAVTVTFSGAMAGMPIVNVSPDTPVLYAVSKVSATGFTIRIGEALTSPVTFSYVAIASDQPETTVGSSSTASSSLIPFPVNSLGQPVSSDAVWNGCIQGRPLLSSDGTPYSCSRYHSDHTWDHPDLRISFIYNPNHDPAILVIPEGYQVVVVGDEGEITPVEPTPEPEPLVTVDEPEDSSGQVSDANAGTGSTEIPEIVPSSEIGSEIPVEPSVEDQPAPEFLTEPVVEGGTASILIEE